jgi:hypothetical protein
MRRAGIVSFLGALVLCSVFIQPFGSYVKADPPQRRWQRFYDSGSGNDRAVDLFVDGTDVFASVYVTGPSPSFCDSQYGADYVTIKYHRQGAELWNKRYNHSSLAPCNDTPYSIAGDASGVYVSGSFQAAGTDYYATVKYELDGTNDQVSRYNDWAGTCAGDGFLCPATFLEEGYPSVAKDNAVVSGGIVVTGTSKQSTQEHMDYVTIKFDAVNGDSLWASVYDGPASGSSSSDEPSAIVVDVSGFISVTGKSYGTTDGYDYATVRYDGDGSQQWAKRYPDISLNDSDYGADEAADITVDGSGNIYVTGFSNGENSGHDYFTIKYNSSGTRQWFARYDGGSNMTDEAVAVAVDDVGDVYVTGTSNGTGEDMVTIKYDGSTGNPETSWATNGVARYNGPADADDVATDIAIDNFNGHVYVIGSISVTKNPGQWNERTNKDCIILIYEMATGDLAYDPLMWTRYDRWCDDMSCGDDLPKAIALLDSYLYITGTSDGDKTGSVDYDFLTLRYSKPTTGIMEDEEILFPSSIFFVYPNPFWNITTLHGKGEFEIYDISGRLRNNVQKGLIGENLESGVYFIHQGESVVKVIKIQ